ncbi:hypothetical protein NPN23_23530, partial [Vibrio parahaemolyticus]|nr:hypothetical protein [Vibrio parahaemolyticus]
MRTLHSEIAVPIVNMLVKPGLYSGILNLLAIDLSSYFHSIINSLSIFEKETAFLLLVVFFTC